MSRLRSKTPKFFRIVRNIGVVLASVSGVILAAPIALPASIVTLAGYVALGGSIAASVAQHAKEEE